MTFKRTTLEETLAVSPLLVLDGAMSTPLENMGIDLNTKLWTAKVLADQPEMVKQVHKNYFKAGADCGITCSYQATVPGLMDIGYTKEQAEELIAKSVEIFLEAREEWWQEEGEKAGHTRPLCLASVGPYGAYLADGSEYRGHYEVSEETLYEFHKHRMELLWEAGADLLLETLDALENGTVTPQKQGESPTAYAKMLTKDMGAIDWNRPAKELERLIRGLNPWPSAYTKLNGKTLKIWAADVCGQTGEKAQPGTVLKAEKDEFLIQTGEKILSVKELQLEGKKRMDTAAFLRGCHLEKGMIL